VDKYKIFNDGVDRWAIVDTEKDKKKVGTIRFNQENEAYIIIKNNIQLTPFDLHKIASVMNNFKSNFSFNHNCYKGANELIGAIVGGMGMGIENQVAKYN